MMQPLTTQSQATQEICDTRPEMPPGADAPAAAPVQAHRETQPTGKRNAVQRQLYDEAYRFNFFKAVHLLEHFSGNRVQGAGLSPDQDPVHFSVAPGFAFPASDIQGITVNGNGDAPKMNVNFMGLIGPKGVLPDWYNAHALACRADKNECFNDFLDLFHQRLISLFYRAWKKYRLVENYRADGGDTISRTLACLVGGRPKKQKAVSGGVDPFYRRLLFFCGLAARTVPTVAAIETIVGQAVGAPVRVEQFVERLIPIHQRDRTRLGQKNSTLKSDALCGRAVRDIASFFRVHIGPLTWNHYLAFAPRSRNLKKVRHLIAHLAGMEYEFDIRLIIPGSEIPAMPIGPKGATPMLGRTAIMRRPHRPLECDIVISVNHRADGLNGYPTDNGKAS
ncbi:MAG: type VI secretion system baseplate subunit TssG [Desulfatitalea sp.]|nr:type VI secretion system baseplate subunit TssG [Desulfatitalea sp.]NNK01208.1 type VI secretion system baseplate subunit TssG [Desulfatitalea sp.]